MCEMKRYSNIIFEIQVFDHTEGLTGYLKRTQTINGEQVKIIPSEHAQSCPQRGENVYWINPEYVKSEMFKYADKFNWTNGFVNLWINDVRVTKDNYRTKVIDQEATETSEEVWHYEYLDYNLMSDVAPEPEQDI